MTYARSDTDTEFIGDQLDDPIYRVSGAGPFVGLDALIRVDPDAYTAYTKSYYGATIMIHGSRVYPQAGDKTTFGQPGCDVTIAVIPSVVVSQPAIRDLPLADRNCFFDDERRLRTTTKYTYQSCIAECAVDTILRVCDCLPFYYMEVRLQPFFEGRRQCTLNDSMCLRDNRRECARVQIRIRTHRSSMLCYAACAQTFSTACSRTTRTKRSANDVRAACPAAPRRTTRCKR